MRRKLVVGNWKMHGTAAWCNELAGALVSGVSSDTCVEIAVCAPFPYLAGVGQVLAGSSIALGAQTVSEFANGAYTGEVSAAMLQDLGCRYVIVGHSERRSVQGESDELIVEKLKAALAYDLIPIFCVGETLEERESGTTEAVLARQLKPLLDRVAASELAGVILAYEPVWAIGTGKTATPELAQQVHAFIRSLLSKVAVDVAGKIPILYGGSVKPQNAAELFSQPDIDGGLVGGAALVADDFLSICRAI